MADRFAELARPAFTAAEGPSVTVVAGLGLACLAAAVATDPDAVEAGPVICPFRLATGLPCPGCGLTRSWVFLTHGRWAEAMAANPFGLVAMVAVVVLGCAVVGSVVRGRPCPSVSRIVSSKGFYVVASLWIAFGVVRLVVTAATT
jgi:Protein of unknown function (DUF2752)